MREDELNPCGLFQINKLDKAVAAANTFFLANPDHMEMKQNLEYYRMMAGVEAEDFKDLEARTHMVRTPSLMGIFVLSASRPIFIYNVILLAFQ